MKDAALILGWAVACAFAVATLWSQQRLHQSDLLLSDAQAKLEDMAKTQEATGEELKAIRQELALAKRAPNAEHTPKAPAEAHPAPSAEGEMEAEPQAPDGASQQEKALLRTQASALTDMAYRGFYGEANLSPEQEQAVRDVLIDLAASSQTARMKAMRSFNTPGKTVKQQIDAARAQAREKLAPLLNNAQLQLWDTYEVNSEQRLYEGVLDGQLTMLAPELTEVNRQVARSVIAEELVNQFRVLEDSDEPYTTSSFNQAQSRALQSALAVLAESFDEEQMSVVQHFVDRAEEMFAAMGQ